MGTTKHLEDNAHCTIIFGGRKSFSSKTDRKQLNVFERKVYRRILGPVHDNKKENWRILTNKEIYARVKKTYCNRDGKVK
jgi:flagellar motor switch protein FliM